MRPDIQQRLTDFDTKINMAMGNMAVSSEDRQRLVEQKEELNSVLTSHLSRMKDAEDSLVSEIDRLSRNVDYLIERFPTN